MMRERHGFQASCVFLSFLPSYSFLSSFRRLFFFPTWGNVISHSRENARQERIERAYQHLLPARETASDPIDSTLSGGTCKSTTARSVSSVASSSGTGPAIAAAACSRRRRGLPSSRRRDIKPTTQGARSWLPPRRAITSRMRPRRTTSSTSPRPRWMGSSVPRRASSSIRQGLRRGACPPRGKGMGSWLYLPAQRGKQSPFR